MSNQAPSEHIPRRLSWFTLCCLWLILSCGGLAMLSMYANSQGSSQSTSSEWPVDSKLQLSERGATLLLFAHPRCPCTRATLGELEKIVARFKNSVTVRVLFFKPHDSDESWDETDLRKTATAIPGVLVVSDVEGVEARRFNATTSGAAFLYDDQGKLLFSGGITLARGHAGDNPGRSALESSLTDAVRPCCHTPVFGCPIAVSIEQE